MNSTPRRETDAERISRQVRTHHEHVIANPSQYPQAEVEAARLHEYQQARLSIASTLRYD